MDLNDTQLRNAESIVKNHKKMAVLAYFGGGGGVKGHFSSAQPQFLQNV